MSPPPRHVLVHLIGHHDVHLEVSLANAVKLGLPESFAMVSTGNLLRELLASPQPLRLSDDRIECSMPLPVPWSRAQIRRRLGLRQQPRPEDSAAPSTLVAVRLPILAAVLACIRQKAADCDLRLVLISSGSAAHNDSKGSSTRGLTAAIAELLDRSGLMPAKAIEHLHFETANPHSFDTLPSFLRTVGATVAAHRRAEVATDLEGWAKRFRLSMSLNTGPTPLITGLLRGLEEFGPHLVVVPDARRSPEKDKAPRRFTAELLDQDGVRQRPPESATNYVTHPAVHAAIEGMRAWRDDFCAARPTRPDALKDRESRFWFRKGLKEVLAVLVVRDPADNALRTFRGVNLEVSLPTGTLCAERNAIGTAIASLPAIERRHIEAVAVLSLSGEPRLGPCGACAEWLRKITEVNPDMRVVTFADVDATQVFVDPVSPA